LPSPCIINIYDSETSKKHFRLDLTRN